MCERLDWNSSPKDDRTYLQRYIYLYISIYKYNSFIYVLIQLLLYCTIIQLLCVCIHTCVYIYTCTYVYIYAYTYMCMHIHICVCICINLPWPRIQSRSHIFPKEKVGDVVQVNALEDEKAGLVESQPISATAGKWDPVTHACQSF